MTTIGFRIHGIEAVMLLGDYIPWMEACLHHVIPARNYGMMGFRSGARFYQFALEGS